MFSIAPWHHDLATYIIFFCALILKDGGIALINQLDMR